MLALGIVCNDKAQGLLEFQRRGVLLLDAVYEPVSKQLDKAKRGERLRRRGHCICNTEGSKIGRRHVSTLMRRMGIEAIYRRPNTSKPAPGHRIYPYLLRGLMIDHPNHVWRPISPTSRWRAALSISRP
jgi:hypothetical protein